MEAGIIEEKKRRSTVSRAHPPEVRKEEKTKR